MSNLPAITGPQLIKLLLKDGWTEHGRRTHGIALKKMVDDRVIVTIVSTKNESLPQKTLGLILGPKQTKIGTKGLQKLVDKFGL